MVDRLRLGLDFWSHRHNNQHLHRVVMMTNRICPERRRSKEHFDKQAQDLPDRLYQRLTGKGIHVPLGSRIVEESLGGRPSQASPKKKHSKKKKKPKRFYPMHK